MGLPGLPHLPEVTQRAPLALRLTLLSLDLHHFHTGLRAQGPQDRQQGGERLLVVPAVVGDLHVPRSDAATAERGVQRHPLTAGIDLEPHVVGEERPLRQWDFVHCPAKTEHTIIGAESGCVVVAVGARDRSPGPVRGYTVNEAALRQNAGVEEETSDPDEAYARFAPSERSRYREGLLP